MKVAVHGRARNEKSEGFIRDFFPKLANVCKDVLLSEDLSQILKGDVPENATVLPSKELAKKSPNVFISLGGDGTILETTGLVARTGIPILGINTGRLGYLSSVGHDSAIEAVNKLIEGQYNIEERRLLELNIPNNPLGDMNFALNEFAIHKSESTSMITVHVDIDGIFLNSYWADGLIISTPTGSTGYSLSCGGPIVAPDTYNTILTPIAPHNLTVRPLIINNNCTLTLRVDSNNEHFRISADSRTYTIEPATELKIKLANHRIKFVHFSTQDHYATLRSKLMWGHDGRN